MRGDTLDAAGHDEGCRVGNVKEIRRNRLGGGTSNEQENQGERKEYSSQTP